MTTNSRFILILFRVDHNRVFTIRTLGYPVFSHLDIFIVTGLVDYSV